MLRFKILASAVPLVVVAIFARSGFLPGPHPCILVGEKAVEIAGLPWRADLHVSFTEDEALATVRVQLSDSAEAADFVVIDDADTADASTCEASLERTLVSISPQASNDAPVIYIAPDGPADYRIFVSSKTFTARDTAALIVGASDGHRKLIAASL
jgi:hypothetical protein